MEFDKPAISCMKSEELVGFVTLGQIVVVCEYKKREVFLFPIKNRVKCYLARRRYQPKVEHFGDSEFLRWHRLELKGHSGSMKVNF